MGGTEYCEEHPEEALMAAEEHRKYESGRFTIVPAPGPTYRAGKAEQAALTEIRKVSERAKRRIAASGRSSKAK